MTHNYPFPVSLINLNDDLEIAYMDTLAGNTTLLMVHGLASYAPIWENNMAVLQKYYRCIAIDLPGHGLSSKGNFEYSIPFYAKIVIQFLEKLEIKQCVLIGHSMGGQTASYLAMQKPDLFSHLVLVAPAGFEVFSATEKIMLAQFVSSNIMASSQYLKYVLNLKNYFYDLDEKEYEKLNEMNRDFYSLSKNQMLPFILARSVKGMMDTPIFDDLDKIILPTLVLFGKNDKLIPNQLLHPAQTIEEITLKACAKIANAQLKMYEKCGHFLQYQYPNRFNMDLYKFLNPLVFA